MTQIAGLAFLIIIAILVYHNYEKEKLKNQISYTENKKTSSENNLEAYKWLKKQKKYPELIKKLEKLHGNDYEVIKEEYEEEVELLTKKNA